MATVIFYEKPGCLNNTRQKQLLAAAGHEVVVKSLLTEAWQPEGLRTFFGELAVRDWFNPSSPRIKQGEVKPDQLSAAEALALMIADPLLIRRPLMQVGERLQVGFDQQQVDAWIGLGEGSGKQDLETCTRPAAGSCQVPS